MDNYRAFGVGPWELKLRAEEAGTPKSCTNVDHIAQERWRPPLVDADRHARRSTQVLKEKIGRNCTSTSKKLVRRLVSRSQMKTPKADALWRMKAAKDRRDDFYDPERKDNILERDETRLKLWEEHLKDPIVAVVLWGFSA